MYKVHSPVFTCMYILKCSLPRSKGFILSWLLYCGWCALASVDTEAVVVFSCEEVIPMSSLCSNTTCKCFGGAVRVCLEEG